MSLEVIFQSAKLTFSAIRELHECYSQTKDFLDCYKNSYIMAIAYSLEALSGLLTEGSVYCVDEQIYNDFCVEPTSFEEAIVNLVDFINTSNELFEKYSGDAIKKFPYTSMGTRCQTYFCLLIEVEDRT
jgi:hypothetical protein